MIERFCDEYDINVAIHNHGPDQSPVYWRPGGVLKVYEDRSRRISVRGGLPDAAGIDPIEAVRMLKGG